MGELETEIKKKIYLTPTMNNSLWSDLKKKKKQAV